MPLATRPAKANASHTSTVCYEQNRRLTCVRVCPQRFVATPLRRQSRSAIRVINRPGPAARVPAPKLLNRSRRIIHNAYVNERAKRREIERRSAIRVTTAHDQTDAHRECYRERDPCAHHG